jgi:hypothetical protein
MRRYTRPVRRAILFLAAVLTALALPLISGASLHSTVGKPAARHDVTGHFTLRVRYKSGPWVTKLSLRLNKYRLWEFRLCGVWQWPAGRRFTCLGAGTKLPARTSARLEQSPIGKALRRDDSPGWGMVGFSLDPVIKAALSNTETGNVYGTFYYRVSLRDLQGKILLTSNKVQVNWHR